MSRIRTWLALALCTLVCGLGLAAWQVAPVAAQNDSDSSSTVGGGTTKEVAVCQGGGSCNVFIDTYIAPFVKVLTGLVGVAAVISLVVAGIQYSAAADDAGAVAKAKSRIMSTLLGLAAYMFLFAFLNYIIPGGLL